MFVIILCSLFAGEPSVSNNGSGLATVHAASARSQDIQQVAIEAITGRSLTVSLARPAVVDRRGYADPQSEIVESITGRDIQYPKTSDMSAAGVDLQSAIVRSITGRK
jgi:hypothetical protein